jgi:hypothetical protein
MEAAMTYPGISEGSPNSGFTGTIPLARSLFWTTPADRTRAIAARAKAAASPRMFFVNIDLVFSDVGTEHASSEQIFHAIGALHLSNNPRDRKIAERITALYRDALADGERIGRTSLGQFTDFFLTHPDLGLPKITLTPDGTLRARWIHGPENFVAIEFTGGLLVKLVA